VQAKAIWITERKGDSDLIQIPDPIPNFNQRAQVKTFNNDRSVQSQIKIDCEIFFAGQPATPGGLVSKEVGSVVFVTAVLIAGTLLTFRLRNPALAASCQSYR